MHNRLDAPRSRHDAYTLRRLQACVQQAVELLAEGGNLKSGHGTVVDFGAGDAPYRSLIEARCKTYLACDLEAREGVDLVFEEGHPIALPAGAADCVVSFQVLEHVWDLAAYLGECRRLLRPDGRLLLSTHGTWLYHPHPGDYRRWTRDGLCRELTHHGFDVLHVLPAVGPLAWTTQFRTLAYHHVLGRLGPLGRVVSRALCTLMYWRMAFEDRITPEEMRATNSAIYCVLAKPRHE
ncbi:class I SAM-dependent methyltransferase [Lysobacter soli]|uniref:class I SAM-dependent methyltransferase n=1 Tax=Lysobacter soli TaxID=453783 RepID=UPI0037C5DFEE